MSDCPACEAKRLHTPEEMKYHPYAGHGFNGVEWTHRERDPARHAVAERAIYATTSQRHTSGEAVEVEAAPMRRSGGSQ